MILIEEDEDRVAAEESVNEENNREESYKENQNYNNRLRMH